MMLIFLITVAIWLIDAAMFPPGFYRGWIKEYPNINCTDFDGYPLSGPSVDHIDIYRRKKRLVDGVKIENYEMQNDKLNHGSVEDDDTINLPVGDSILPEEALEFFPGGKKIQVLNPQNFPQEPVITYGKRINFRSMITPLKNKRLLAEAFPTAFTYKTTTTMSYD